MHRNDVATILRKKGQVHANLLAPSSPFLGFLCRSICSLVANALVRTLSKSAITSCGVHQDKQIMPWVNAIIA